MDDWHHLIASWTQELNPLQCVALQQIPPVKALFTRDFDNQEKKWIIEILLQLAQWPAHLWDWDELERAVVSQQLRELHSNPYIVVAKIKIK